MNQFFASIAERTRAEVINPLNDNREYYVDSNCDFMPPALEDIYSYMLDIDIHSSSCIKGVNCKICKILPDKIPDKFRHLFANSLFFGIFPATWTCATVTLLPKKGEKNQAGNWRPVSQTVIFAKILEKNCT